MDAADLDRLRRLQDSRASRKWWATLRRRFRLHPPRYLSLVNSGAQPVRSSAVPRWRYAYGSVATAMLMALVLPHAASAPASLAHPPQLSSPDAPASSAPTVSEPSRTRLAPSSPAPVAVAHTVSVPPTSSSTTVQSGPAVVPVAIRIPVIGVVSHDVVPVGLNLDRTLAVPPLSKVGELGWYASSPVPGDIGPAVVVAHVDQDGHLGLFARLDQLEPGDVVAIDRSDHQTAMFRVTERAEFPKAAFPAALVYSNTPDPELRLITCTGAVDVVHHRYLDQEVVLAQFLHLRPTRQ